VCRSLVIGVPLADRQRGAATLIVVMVLFFVLTMVAAYTSRNVIFEQRTASNQHHQTVSFEAAEAGLEWALSQLNGPRVDDACLPSTNLAHQSFRERYLATDPASGLITVPAAVRDGPVWPSCAYVSGAWTCSCPMGTGPVMPAPEPTGLTPSFRVRFLQPTPLKPGVVRVEVMGCTSTEESCLNFPPAHAGQCGGTVCALAAMQGGLKSLPVAALTARGNVDFGGAPSVIANTVAGSTGLSVVAGGAINSVALALSGPPGTPASRTIVSNDPGLADPLFDGPRMFAAAFGVWPATFGEQPGSVALNCAVPCGSTALRTAALENPRRVLRVAGGLSLDGGDIGSPTEPVLIVLSGSLTFAAPTNVFGLVYSMADDWTTSGTGTINGAAIAQGNVGGTGAYTVSYDSDLLTDLRWRTGSFVRVPGSWKDFP